MSEEVIAPYRKKKDSSTSKSSKKSDHKHIWDDCFIHATLPEKYCWVQDPIKKKEFLDALSPGSRCILCGRLKLNYQTELRYAREGGFLRRLTNNEMLRLHPNWTIYEVPGEDWYKL